MKGTLEADLKKEAEKKYPMPVNPCSWVRAKIEWKRKEWINTKKQQHARI